MKPIYNSCVSLIILIKNISLLIGKPINEGGNILNEKE